MPTRSPGSTMSRATSTRSPTGSPGCAPGPISPTAPTGSPSPAAMAERALAVEEKLSDALHERLTQRFVDRRTSVLMRDLGRKGAGEFPVHRSTSRARSASAPIAIGRLQGFSFEVDPAARHADRKMLLATAERRLAGEYEKRAAALVADSDEHFSLRTEAGRPVAILWRGHEVARLGPGKNLLSPARPARPAARSRVAARPRRGDRAAAGLGPRARSSGRSRRCARPAPPPRIRQRRRRRCARCWRCWSTKAGSSRATQVAAAARRARPRAAPRRHRASASASARSTCSCRRC